MSRYRKLAARVLCVRLPARLLAVLGLAAVALSAQVGGSVAGLVRDFAGVPQMGATVDLLAADGRVLKQVESDYRGWFQVTGVFPGTYSIRVLQANFSPATKSGIEVEPGERTFLDVSLSGVFASLQLAYGSQVRDMSERWKWVLRARYSRRNVLRFAPAGRDDRDEFLRRLGGTFEDTRGYAEFSTGRGSRSNGLQSQQDLGTAFAVATTLFGDHDLTVSGNAGRGALDAMGGSAAFRTSYTREVGLARPEVALTVRQLQSSAVASRGFIGPENQSQATPRLETLTLEFADSVRLTDVLRVEYGLLFESVKFARRLQFASPYGRAVYEFRPGRELVVAYASGVPPSPSGLSAGDAMLRSSVRQLGLFPRVTMIQGRPTVQRSEHMEIAYRHRVGKNLVEVAVYRDTIRDAAVAAAVPDSLYGPGDVVPDLRAATATLNGGHHRSKGMRISYARRLRDRLQAALGYGHAGVVVASGERLDSSAPEALRSMLDTQGAHLLLASLSAEVPSAGTSVTGSYQWSSRQAVLAADPYNDFASQSAPGLNLQLRQPLPFGDSVPGRFEASADFRNLLKTGYVSLRVPDGRMLNLLQAIRSYSGALTYIF